MSTPALSGNKNPYVTGGINKSLLTPCRRIGLSRKIKTPASTTKTPVGISKTPLNNSHGTPTNLNGTPSLVVKNETPVTKIKHTQTLNGTPPSSIIQNKTPASNIQRDTRNKHDRQSKKLVSKKLNMENVNVKSEMVDHGNNKDSDSDEDVPLASVIKVEAIIETNRTSGKQNVEQKLQVEDGETTNGDKAKDETNSPDDKDVKNQYKRNRDDDENSTVKKPSKRVKKDEEHKENTSNALNINTEIKNDQLSNRRARKAVNYCDDFEKNSKQKGKEDNKVKTTKIPADNKAELPADVAKNHSHLNKEKCEDKHFGNEPQEISPESAIINPIIIDDQLSKRRARKVVNYFDEDNHEKTHKQKGKDDKNVNHTKRLANNKAEVQADIANNVDNVNKEKCVDTQIGNDLQVTSPDSDFNPITTNDQFSNRRTRKVVNYCEEDHSNKTGKLKEKTVKNAKLAVLVSQMDVVVNNSCVKNKETNEDNCNKNEPKKNIKNKKKYVIDSDDSDDDFQFNPSATKRTYTVKTNDSDPIKIKIKKLTSSSQDLQPSTKQKPVARIDSAEMDLKNLKEMEENLTAKLDSKLIVLEKHYNDDEDNDFTSSPHQEDKETILKKIKDLEGSMKQKKELISKYKQATVYKNMHDVKKLQELTGKWEHGCKEALQDLLKQLQAHGPMEMSSLVKKLNIPTDMANKLKLVVST